MKVGLYGRDLDRRDGMTAATLRMARALRQLGHDVDIVSEAVPRTQRYDLFINNLPGACFPSMARRSWLWVHALPRKKPPYLRFYEVLANSRFTQRELSRAWGVRSRVLHPPADAAPALRKEKLLLSVGTFGSARWPKRELQLIRLFKRLHRRGELRGWSYHLAGADEGGAAWLSRLRLEAQGAPISFHVDAPQAALARLYGRASLLWHACRREHFGLAVVEAMGAGCLPLAFDAAGPAETIRHGRTGWLYGDFEELARLTGRAAGKMDLAPLRRAAIDRGAAYGTAEFKRQFARLCSRAEGRR